MSEGAGQAQDVLRLKVPYTAKVMLATVRQALGRPPGAA